MRPGRSVEVVNWAWSLPPACQRTGVRLAVDVNVTVPVGVPWYDGAVTRP